MSKQKVTLGSFIANQRERLGNISQVELAKKCGVPAGTIASIESGYAKSPRPVTLKKLAEGLTIPADIIFRLASSPEKEICLNYEELNNLRIPYFGNVPASVNGKFKSDLNADTNLVFPLEIIDEGDFVVTITGSCLANEDIYDGDYIVISRQDYLRRSGDMMLCTIGNDTSLQRVYKEEEGYTIAGETVSKEDVCFVGRACMSINKRKL